LGRRNKIKSIFGGTMKSKVLLGVAIFVVLFVFLIMTSSLSFLEGETDGDNPEKSKYLVKFKPDDFSADGKKEVMNRIEVILKELEKLSSKGKLNTNRISRIADFFGESGVFTKHDGNTLVGGTAIGNYFDQERGNIENIEFELQYVFAEELTHILEKPSPTPEKDIVHVLYIVVSSSFDYKGDRIDPGGSTTEKHMKSCEWD
jgi:hypothetical protein